MLLYFEPIICTVFSEDVETSLRFQIKQYGVVLDSVCPSADEGIIISVCAFVFGILRSCVSCVSVPVAHLLLSEEGCMGLWPPGSSDGQ